MRLLHLTLHGVASCRLGLCCVGGTGRRHFPAGFSGGGLRNRAVDAPLSQQRLGGYTGDCLGALEQILELFVVLWLALF